MSRLDDLLKEAKNHFSEVYNTLDKGSTGRNIRHDKNALISTINLAFPATAHDPQRASMDDLLAFGGVGTGITKGLPKTSFSKAHETARKNAMLPVEQGGLGLPENNTAMDRARALGFDVDTPVYHGTGADITEFNPLLADSRRKTGTPSNSLVVSSNPKTASTYANDLNGEWTIDYGEGGNVLPLLINKGKNLSMIAGDKSYTPNWDDIYNPKFPEIETTNDFALLAKNKKKDSATIKKVKDNARISGEEGDTTFLFKPENIRSRFAAFDPLKKNSTNILASLLAGTALLNQKEDKK